MINVNEIKVLSVHTVFYPKCLITLFLPNVQGVDFIHVCWSHFKFGFGTYFFDWQKHL